jgi:hypothetical protein
MGCRVVARLTEWEAAQGFVRPLRDALRHLSCGTASTLPKMAAEAFARQPDGQTATYCIHCRARYPVSQFIWLDGSNEVVGS